MAWSFVRPADASVLTGRPLLDLGTGDAQTLLALTSDHGLRVGVDRSSDALRAARRSGLRNAVMATVELLPLSASTIRTVVAGDLFHHASDTELRRTLGEIGRVLRPDGRLVAWWYGRSGRGGPGDPRFPRSYEDVARLASAAGLLSVAPLELAFALEPAPPTIGIVARR